MSQDRDTANGPSLRHLPAVEKLLGSTEVAPLIERYSHPLVTRAIQDTLTTLRGCREGK
jgi:hypothetical protein